jgi:CRP-like cAMP-binding protein
MTAPEKVALTSQMLRKEYPPGALIVKEGTVLDTLCIVSDGVLVARGEDNGREIEVTRLAPGEYFGELALLTGEPLHSRITALTRVVIYEISKDALAPLLKARPSMVEELSQNLASRQLAHRSLLDRHHHVEQHEERRSERLTATIRRLFALH